ncbi:hypothetical protein GCM10009665_58410 [Kitasatospora nipponensis]|uniref:RsiW-degrading membrane proteinase PrsW (M82 family) n=1 Tax=Kitasatospora nipponensis TaxID=258049 RepID=A0ABP4HHK4_9ACTN
MTTVITGRELEETRAAALDASGWGTPFRIVQWHNACFWVLVLGLLAGAEQLVEFYQRGAGAYGTALTVGAIAFSLYTVPWVFLLRRHNRYTSLPARLFVVAFAWGVLTATFVMALHANSAAISLEGKLFGHGWIGDWGPGLTAPFTEESAKATALVLLIGLAPRLVRSPYHGLLIGAFAGLGFQIAEDVLYAYNSAVQSFGADQAGAALVVVVGRSVTGLTTHALFSAVYCAGLMWLIGRGGAAHRLRGLLLVAGAMLGHGSVDCLASMGPALGGALGGLAALPGLLAALGGLVLLSVASLLLLRLTFKLALPQERRWLRDILAPEVAAGLFTQAELTAATGSRRDRRAFRRSLHGSDQRRTGKRVLAAVRRLARQLALAQGASTDEVARAREEVFRLRAGG